jgi:hypothetical protein
MSERRQSRDRRKSVVAGGKSTSCHPETVKLRFIHHNAGTLDGCPAKGQYGCLCGVVVERDRPTVEVRCDEFPNADQDDPNREYDSILVSRHTAGRMASSTDHDRSHGAVENDRKAV